MRGIRGAITVEENTKNAIWKAGRRLVEAIIEANDIRTDDIGAVIFTMTEDLTAAFPATGAREIKGFEIVPLFDARQPAVDDSLPKCIRVLILADTDKSQKNIHHIYMEGAKQLRPDLNNK